MLDVDALRVDKATQVTTDYLAEWGQSVHECATRYGKNNFYIAGEVTGGDTFGAIYVGRGRQPNHRPPDLSTALTLSNTSSEKFFLRSAGEVAIDGVAFHYSMYRALTRFLWMDGNLEVAYDTPADFVDMWNTMAITNDFVNSQTNKVDPRHLYGTTNQDNFRWPSIINGTQKQNLAAFACALIVPGIHAVSIPLIRTRVDSGSCCGVKNKNFIFSTTQHQIISLADKPCPRRGPGKITAVTNLIQPNITTLAQSLIAVPMAVKSTLTAWITETPPPRSVDTSRPCTFYVKITPR